MDDASAHGKDHHVDDLLLSVFQAQCRRLRAFFLRGVGMEPAADDLVQETLLRAWLHRESVARDLDTMEHAPARRYLWRVARNLLIDEIRGRRRRRARESVAWSEPVGTTPVDDLEREDCLRIIRETVDRLPNRRARRCLQLWLTGCDVRAIAREVGLAGGKVRGLLGRGRSEAIRRARARLEA